MTKKRITIADIAREAGVSKATVSRVISNPDLVRAKTREQILAIMESHAYIPNHLAQGLAGTPTKTIGVVIDELSNYFFIEIAEGIDRVLGSHGYSMQLSSSRWIQERETALVRSLISSRVDGILLAPVSARSESISLMQRSGMPFVLINCVPDSVAASYVSCDNYRGGQLVADYINAHKREQTILITGFPHQTVTQRIAGLESHLDVSVQLKRYPDIKTFEDGYQLIPLLLYREKIREIPTTLFVTNDNVAIGIINGLREHHIAIPEQVAVIGYDNIRLSALCRVPLTTVSQSIFDMGRMAAMELMDVLQSHTNEPRQHLIVPTLVIRESA